MIPILASLPFFLVGLALGRNGIKDNSIIPLIGFIFLASCVIQSGLHFLYDSFLGLVGFIFGGVIAYIVIR